MHSCLCMGYKHRTMRRMRRSLSDTALDGASALVPDPLPTGPNAAASLIHAGRRSSQDPAEAESSTSYGSPVDTVSSSVGPRAARSAMSARLKQVTLIQVYR